ncbi:phenylacetate--CoA ligase [Fundidesulfovibrio butyratiphilus]
MENPWLQLGWFKRTRSEIEASRHAAIQRLLSAQGAPRTRMVTFEQPPLPSIGLDRFAIRKFRHSGSTFSGGGRTYMSGGTGGRPKMVTYSTQDWLVNIGYRARCLQIAGIGPSSIIATVLPFGPWSTGDSVQEAGELLGAMSVSLGLRPQSLQETISIVDQLGVTDVVTTPSMARLLLRHGGVSQPLNLLLTGERLSGSLRGKLLAAFGGQVTSLYAATEAIIGVECGECDGYHFWDDMLVVEVVDDADRPLPAGATGHVCITRIAGYEATSMIRCKLGDLGTLVDTPCPCGLPFPKIRFAGREAHRFTLFGGVTCSLHQFHAGLASMPFEICGMAATIQDGQDGREELLVRVETDRIDAETREMVRSAIMQSSIDLLDVVASGSVELAAELVPPGTLGVSGQARKTKESVTDLRREPL